MPVHPRGSYYISIGLRTELKKRDNKSKTVEMQFFFKWHIQKPIAGEFDNAIYDLSVPINSFNRKQKHDNAILNLYRPVAIWVEVGNQQKLVELKKEENSSLWKSSNCVASIPTSANSKKDTRFPCLIWINFETGIGEQNSLKILKDMFVQQTNCDVQFCFDGGKRIGGHAAILGARSRVFDVMFQNGMLESKTKEVAIKDIGPEIFKELLHYIYSGRISKELTETTSQSLLLLADMYDIADLKEECFHFLVTCTRIDNAIDLLVWVHVQSVDQVCTFKNNKG